MKYVLYFILIMCFFCLISLFRELIRVDAYHEACMKILDNLDEVAFKHEKDDDPIDVDLLSELYDSTPSVSDMKPGFTLAIFSMIGDKLRGTQKKR